jgi:NO-binding membrane sensor protein with MHYT domain
MHDHAIQCIHDPLLVLLSFVVSVMGSYTALNIAIDLSTNSSRTDQATNVITSGAAMGGGAIWAMHFIAMLACKMDLVVTYDIGLTILSAALAIVACMIGLAIAGLGVFSWGRLAFAGVFMGAGVAGMHYLGMAAMNMAATVRYDVTLVAASIGIAVVASMVALWLAFHMRGVLQRFGSALLMGVAVCGMHYTAMLAAKFEPIEITPPPGLAGEYLGAAVFVTSMVLLALLLALSIANRKKRSLVAI